MANIINTPKLLQAAGFAVEDTSTTNKEGVVYLTGNVMIKLLIMKVIMEVKEKNLL